MKLALDMSSGSIHGLKTSNPDVEFMQLRTPLTQYQRDPLNVIHYGLDNGAYTDFNAPTFTRMALKAKDDPLCDWIVLPDLVGDAGGTQALFFHWMQELDLDHKRAYVAQDGCTIGLVPWSHIECLFIGGTDYFKESKRAMDLAVQARELGIWVHVGRVNTPRRIIYWEIVADSIDGSGMSRYTHMRSKAIIVLRSLRNSMQTKLPEFGDHGQSLDE